MDKAPTFAALTISPFCACLSCGPHFIARSPLPPPQHCFHGLSKPRSLMGFVMITSLPHEADQADRRLAPVYIATRKRPRSLFRKLITASRLLSYQTKSPALSQPKPSLSQSSQTALSLPTVPVTDFLERAAKVMLLFCRPYSSSRRAWT